MSNYTPGAGALWAQRTSDEIPAQFASTAGGLTLAKAQLAPGGVLQMPDLGLALGASWAKIGLILFDANGNVYLSRFHIADGTDPTKRVSLICASVTTGVERTAEFMDWSGIVPLPIDAGASGAFLKSNGAAVQPSWASIANALLDGSNHTDTVAQAVLRGALVVGNSTPKWDRLAIGAANTVLFSNGTDPSWAAASTIAALTQHDLLLHLKPFTVSGNVTINSGSAVLTDASGTNRFASVRVGDRINLDDSHYPTQLFGMVATTSGASDPNNITMDRTNTSGVSYTGGTATVFPGSEHFDKTLLEGLLSTSGWGTFDGGASGSGTMPTVRGSLQFQGYTAGATPLFDFPASDTTGGTSWGFALRKKGTTNRATFYATDLTGSVVYKLPNISGSFLATTSFAQDITDKLYKSNNVFWMEATPGAGNGCSFADPTTPTKKLYFDLTGITAANNRVWTIPDINGKVKLESTIPAALSGATPAIGAARVYKVTNGGATNMTNVTGANDGADIVLIFTNANTTLKDTSTTGSFELAGSGDYAVPANTVMRFVWITADAKWWEISRSND